MNQQRIGIAVLVLNIILFIYLVSFSAIVIYTGRNEDKRFMKYVEIRDSLDTGLNLRLIMDYKYMDYYFNNSKKESPDEKFGFDFSQYQFFARQSIGNPLEYIITSFNTYVYHPKYQSIYNYGKLRIYENENYSLESYFINPLNYSIIEFKTLNGTLTSKGLSFYQQTPKFRKNL